MVGDDDRVDAVVEGDAGVLGGHDPLDDQTHRCQRAKPIDVIPGEGAVQKGGDVGGHRGALGLGRDVAQVDLLLEVAGHDVGRQLQAVPEVCLAAAEAGHVDGDAEG